MKKALPSLNKVCPFPKESYFFLKEHVQYSRMGRETEDCKNMDLGKYNEEVAGSERSCDAGRQVFKGTESEPVSAYNNEAEYCASDQSRSLLFELVKSLLYLSPDDG